MKFEKGTKVRIKPSEVDSFYAETARKIRDRVGEVYGHSWPNGHPLVIFSSVGRRKEFRMGQVNPAWLEVVEGTA